MKYLKTYEELTERIKGFSDLTDTSAQWYGDDISSGGEMPQKTVFNVTKVKKEKGNTARRNQKKRKEKDRINRMYSKIAKVTNFSTTDDLVGTIDTDRKASMDA